MLSFYIKGLNCNNVELNVLLYLQICYGIIYGMGAKSLGEQMGIDENDAACYIETFKSRYTGKFQVTSTTNYTIRLYHS